MNTDERVGPATDVSDISETRPGGHADVRAGATDGRSAAEPRAKAARQAELFPFQPIILSADAGDDIDARAATLARRLASRPDISLAALAQTLIAGSGGCARHRVLVAGSVAEAAALLSTGVGGEVFDHSSVPGSPDVVFLFAGAEVDQSDFARGLYETEPVFRATVDEGLSYCAGRPGRDLRAALMPGSGARVAEDARAILGVVVEVALARLCMSWGVVPSALVFDGAGLAAATVAGVTRFDAAVRLASGYAPDPDAFAAPEVPLLSAATGLPVSDAEARDPSTWQARSEPSDPAALARALGDTPRRVFVELGMGGLSARITAAGLAAGERVIPALAAPSRGVADDRAFFTSLARLHALGVAVDWAQFWDDVELPQVTSPGLLAGATSLGGAGVGPLLDGVSDDAMGGKTFRAVWRPGETWVLDQLQTAEGAPVLSVGIVVALISEAAGTLGREGSLEIRDLALGLPLNGDPAAAVELELRLEPDDAGWRVELTTAGATDRVRHARARIVVLSRPVPPPVDFGAVALRCRDGMEAAPPGQALATAAEAHFRFGPGWQVLREAARGPVDGLARLSLSEDECHRLADGTALHPGLFDVASLWAADLAGDVAGLGRGYMVSVGAIRVHKPLPAEFASWVRAQEGDGSRLDVALCALDGTPLVEVEALRLHPVTDDGAQEPEGVEPEAPEVAQSSPELLNEPEAAGETGHDAADFASAPDEPPVPEEAAAEDAAADPERADTAKAEPDSAAEEPRGDPVPAVSAHRPAQPAPVFLLAELNREAMRLAPVTELLRAERNVHGLVGGYIVDDPARWTVEQAARIHMSEIRRVQPEGPYVIAGIGGDGITALEIARLFKSERQETALVILFDTHPVLDPARALNEIEPTDRREVPRSRTGQLIGRAKSRVAERLRRRPSEEEIAEAELAERIERARQGALAGYTPRPYDMNVTLLVSKSDTSRKARRARKKASAATPKIGDYGWGRWIPRLEVEELPGDLGSIANAADANEIGAFLKARIETALKNSGEPVHWHSAKAAE